VIAPTLFDLALEAAKELKEKRAITRPVSPNSPALEFSRNFFAQFADGLLGIEVESLTILAAREVNVAAKKRRDLTPGARRLARRFQHLCKLAPNVTGGDYGGRRQVYRDFHEHFMPHLLDDIVTWAEEQDAAALASRAREAAAGYRAALEELHDG
jgi:hypothetical protein